MAKEKKKKIKSFKIEQEELKPLTIGIFESRKKSSIGTFLILTTFILVVVFLPEISDVINKYLKPVVTPVVPNPNPVPGPNIEEEPGNGNLDNMLHEFTENLVITNEDITLSKFIIDSEKNTLTYTLTNNGVTQNIETLNYYIELYNKEQTLIERVKLVSELNLTSGAFREITKNISSTSASSLGYVILIKKTVAEYPEVNLNISEDGVGSLVCSKEHEQVTYKFNNNELQTLTSVLTYNKSDENYEDAYNKVISEMNSYNTLKGVNSTIVGSLETDSFNVVTNVNLSEASRKYIFDADSFKHKTLAKVVKFEMEAQGFKCE